MINTLGRKAESQTEGERLSRKKRDCPGELKGILWGQTSKGPQSPQLKSGKSGWAVASGGFSTAA